MYTDLDRLDSIISSRPEDEGSPGSIVRRKAPKSSRKRASVVAQILADAGRDADEYVERWNVGRGAE